MELLNLQVLKDQSAPSIALMAVVIAKYGVDALNWQPELLRHVLDGDFEIKLTDLQQDKLQAAILVLTSNWFQEQWEVFRVVVNVFNNEHTDFDSFAPTEAEDIAVAMADFMAINGEDDESEPFSDQVRAYAGKVFAEYGMCDAPDIFSTAIVPPSCGHSDTCPCQEKNEALKELFLARTKIIKDYMDRLKL